MRSPTEILREMAEARRRNSVGAPRVPSVPRGQDREGQPTLARHVGSFHALRGGLPAIPIGSTFASSRTSQLAANVDKLRTDTLAVQARSSVTVADLAALRADLRAIASARFRPNRRALRAFKEDLVRAVASANSLGATPDAAQLDKLRSRLARLFDGSAIPAILLDKTFDDALKVARDSHVTTADLDRIAADRAAIEADLQTLRGVASRRATAGAATVGWADIARLLGI